MNNKPPHVMRRFHLAIAAIVVLVDRVSKILVERELPLHDSVPIVPGLLRLTHVKNPGAAFGLFADSPSQWKLGLLVLFSLVALVVVMAILWRSSHSFSTTGVGLALILGGAIGNLWDRLSTGLVVDFFDFYVGSYHWPAFNAADSAIVVGALLVIFEILFAHQAETEAETR